jgi:hypothetical protein
MFDPVSGRAELARLISACWTTKVIGEGVRFGVFDAIAGGKTAAGEIAVDAGVHAGNLYRLMRALTVLGLLKQTGPDSFALTGAGQLLRRDHEDSLSGMAMHWSDRFWNGFSKFDEGIRTGQAIIESGPEHFARMQNEDPAAADVFNRAMAEATIRIGHRLAEAYDFSGFRKVVDVGGGYGALLVGLLKANPHLEGAVFELEGVVGLGNRYIAEHGLSDRVEFVAGSFFEGAPPPADCLLLKYILHDWDDERSRIILRNCREAMHERSAILLIERIVPDIVEAGEEHRSVIQGDMVMLRIGGKERTGTEYAELLHACGLKLKAIHPTASEFSIIEAVRA